MSQDPHSLQQLARAWNLELSYHNDEGQLCTATPESLLLVLRALGADLDRIEQADDALRARRQWVWRRVVEPVVVSWNGDGVDVKLRLPTRETAGTLGCRLELETGEVRFWSVGLGDLPAIEAAEVESVAYKVLKLSLPGPLPLGYHRLGLQINGSSHESLLIGAPNRAHQPPGADLRLWGGFLPLYAMRSGRNWGIGDFTDLENLISWTQRLGGGIVGTLPLLAAFLDEPFEPSPYSPATRLFWNELYLDVERLPEFQTHPKARELVASREFQSACAAQRDFLLVDYRGTMVLKRRVLELLAAGFFAEPGTRLESFRQFMAARPRTEDYARFRATGDKLRSAWHRWPDRQRGGDVRAGDFDEAARRYHLYVQWVADEQIRSLAQKASEKGPGLYLDYPLGVNPDGYDVWRERDSFALGLAAGAPPDSFFTLGQNWGFPPLHPERIRTNGYRHVRDCLRHHMQYAGILRIDHMMGLHRFYWVPPELGPKQGVYVRYAHEEMYAVWCLESVRNRTVLAGEDLGTVPPEVRPLMEKRNIRRLYVGQYEARPDGNNPLGWPAAGSIASLNTHDMPPFASFWTAFDLEDRQLLGLIDDAGREQEKVRRQHIRDSLYYFLRQHGLLGEKADLPRAFKGALEFLARTPAGVVLVNLEELWQAMLPQNVPGTWRERPNWRRKAKYAIEEFDKLPLFRETLQTVDRARREAPW